MDNDVAEYAEAWRAWDRWVTELGTKLWAHEDGDKVLTKWVIENRRILRRYLHSRFGIGFKPAIWLQVIEGTLPLFVRDEWAWFPKSWVEPSDPYESAALFDASDQYTTWRTLFITIGIHARLAKLAGYDVRKAVIDAGLNALRSMPLADGVGIDAWRSFPDRHQHHVLSLAGWAETQLSLGKGRLRNALIASEDPDNNLRSTLRQHLPSAVILAWDENRELVRNLASAKEPIDSLKEIKNTVAELIVDEAPPSEVPQSIKKELLDRSLEAGQEFATREAARAAIDELVSSAHLTSREKEILHLTLHGYEGREIAGKLGVAEGTVRVTLRNARSKLKQAAG